MATCYDNAMDQRALLLGSVLLLCACGGVDRRIKKNQQRYDAYPPAVQESIKQGRVQPGFTPEQVRMAIGEADRVYSRLTGAEAEEIWAYLQSSGGGVGLSVGSVFGGGGGVYGGGVTVPVYGGDHYDEKTRVVFKNGQVASVETRER